MKLSKESKKAGLKAPKCKALGKANAKGQQSATLKVKVGAGVAPGTYGLSFKVRGSRRQGAQGQDRSHAVGPFRTNGALVPHSGTKSPLP